MTYYPQSPTNWTESLEKIYARQSRQLEEHHANLRQRDKQMVDATIGADKISKAISDLGTISKTAKAIADKQDAKKTTKLRTEIEALPLDQQERIEQLALEKSIDGEHTTLKQRLQSDELIPNEIKQTILNLSGGKSLRLKKILASDRVENSISLINEKLDNDPDLQLSYDTAKQAGKLKGWYRNQTRQLLKDINLNDKYISTHFESSIEAVATTKGVLAGIQYDEVALTQNGLISEKSVKTVQTSIENNPNGFAELAQREIKEGVDPSKGIDIAQSKEKFTLKYYRLAKARKLTTDDIVAMKAGKIEGHPSGDTGAILLSDDQWLKIQSGVDEANAEVVKDRETEVKGLANTTKAELYKGDKSIPELIALKENTLTTIKATLGEDSDEYKAIASIDPTLQDKESYAATRQEWSPFFDGDKKGQRIQNEDIIKEIPNGRVRDELLELIEKDKALRIAVGYPSTFDKNKTDVGEKIINANTTLNEESHLTGPVEHMQIEITQKRDLFLADALDRFPDDPQQAFKVADANWEEWLTKNGFYVTADKPGAGRFSPETTGEYKNFKFWNDADIESRSVGDEYNTNKWGTNIAKGLLHVAKNPNLSGDSDVDKLVNIPGSVLDIKDYGALFINGELQYTPEVILKARLLKLQPSELVKRQGEALLKSNNPDHKLIADRIGLKEKLKNIPTSEMDLLKKIQDLGDKELLFIFNRGLDKASPKQIERLLARLEEQVDAPRNTFIMNQGFQENEETKDREGNK